MLWITPAFSDRIPHHYPNHRDGLRCSCEGKQAENKKAKMRNLANAHNTSLLFHQISSLENCQSVERRQRDMQGVRRKKRELSQSWLYWIFMRSLAVCLSRCTGRICTKRSSKSDTTSHPHPRIWMSASQNEAAGFPLKRQVPYKITGRRGGSDLWNNLSECSALLEHSWGGLGRPRWWKGPAAPRHRSLALCFAQPWTLSQQNHTCCYSNSFLPSLEISWLSRSSYKLELTCGYNCLKPKQHGAN